MPSGSRISNNDALKIDKAKKEVLFKILDKMGVFGNEPDKDSITISAQGKKWVLKPFSVNNSNIKRLHYSKLIQAPGGRLVTDDQIDFWDSISVIENHSELNLDDGTNPHGTTKYDVNLGSVDDVKQIPFSEKGSPLGVAPLNSSSKIDSAYLPSYVDDVEEYPNTSSFPLSGEAGKIYVDISSSKIYRWSGLLYIEISSTEVPQATESLLGGGKVATDATTSDNSTVNDTDIITPKKLWSSFVPKFLNSAWTWLLKQTFSIAPKLNYATANQILETDSNKEITSVSKNGAYNKNFGSTSGTVAQGNDFRFGQSEQARTYSSVSLANNTARTPSSVNDVIVIITPSLQANVGQTSSIQIQVDNSGGGTFTTIATSTNTNAFTITLGLLGGSSTQAQPITFKVPKGSQYRYVTSGSGATAILSHVELQD